MNENELLDENAVISHVIAALTANGWSVTHFATTTQAGVDVDAVRGSDHLYVEAKGITSSKPTSSLFGQAQTSSQVFISVAAALLKAAEFRSRHPSAVVVIAVPRHSRMELRIGRILPVLEAARIGVLWVAADGIVTAVNCQVLEPLAA